MPEYSVELIGPHLDSPGLPATLAYHLIAALYKSAKGSVRLEVEGRSSAPGTQPAWLNRVANFQVDIAKDFPGLKVHAPTLGEASPDRFGQGALFEDSIGDQSALSFLFRGLSDALCGRADSDAYDANLLKAFDNFGYVLGNQGVSAIAIRNGKADGPTVRIDSAGLARAEGLQERTPAPRHVRIAGTLDAIRYSDSGFALLLRDRETTTIRGYLSDTADTSQLATFWGKSVVLSGYTHFRPSGAPLRIEAQHIRLASSNDIAIFSRVPQSMDARLETRFITRPQDSTTGINAIFGRWPGDETAEEIIEALENA
jgi:hypothetical protein